MYSCAILPFITYSVPTAFVKLGVLVFSLPLSICLFFW